MCNLLNWPRRSLRFICLFGTPGNQRLRLIYCLIYSPANRIYVNAAPSPGQIHCPPHKSTSLKNAIIICALESCRISQFFLHSLRQSGFACFSAVNIYTNFMYAWRWANNLFSRKDCLSWILRRLRRVWNWFWLFANVCDSSSNGVRAEIIERWVQLMPREYWSIIDWAVLLWLTSSISIPNICDCNLSSSFSPYGHRVAIERHTPKKKRKNDQRQFIYFLDSFRKREWFAFRSDDGIKVFVLLIFIFRSLL